MEKVLFELDLLGLEARSGGRADTGGPFHIQRAQTARLRSQEIGPRKSKQFSLAGAWRA